jgi:nucleoid-associated protein YgaU
MEPAAPVKPAATKTQESEPGVRMHPIAEGETLFSICKREYNDGSLSLALAKYNKNVIPDPKKLRKGVTIRIPSAETLRGEGKSTRVEAAPKQPASNEVIALAAADVITAETKTAPGGVVNVEVAPGGKGASKSAAKPTQSADASKGSTYTVRKGDTLYSIAQRELGNKSRWQEIAALNGGNDSLSPGATIKLPARR